LTTDGCLSEAEKPWAERTEALHRAAAYVGSHQFRILLPQQSRSARRRILKIMGTAFRYARWRARRVFFLAAANCRLLQGTVSARLTATRFDGGVIGLLLFALITNPAIPVLTISAIAAAASAVIAWRLSRRQFEDSRRQLDDKLRQHFREVRGAREFAIMKEVVNIVKKDGVLAMFGAEGIWEKTCRSLGALAQAAAINPMLSSWERVLRFAEYEIVQQFLDAVRSAFNQICGLIKRLERVA
jgi:hypothetical protein